MFPRFYRITFALGGLEGQLALKQVATILETLVWTHALYLKENPRTPLVYDLLRSGALRYEDQPTGFREEGQDDWSDIASTLKPRPDGTRAANAPSLAAWRAAELRVRFGVHAKVAIYSRLERDGRVSLRPIVHLPNGEIEDPSNGLGWRILGMADHHDRARITFVLDLFNPGQRVLSHATLQCMLDGLTDVDARYLRHHPETPLLYESGVRYEEEPPGQEDWQDIPTTLRLGVGDCDDLGPWRAAEHRALFWQDARPLFSDQTMPNGASLYHIKTMLPDGRTEDPSRVTGMR